MFPRISETRAKGKLYRYVKIVENYWHKGQSKDHRPDKHQIVISLLVTDEVIPKAIEEIRAYDSS